MNNIVIPGSKTESHILDNINIFDFELTKDDMNKIASLDKGEPFYKRNDENLKRFAAWVPNVDKVA